MDFRTLPEREVHVWFVELTPATASLEECSRSLSADEKERAARFRFEHLQTSFTLSRGTLRILLGSYLSIEPARVRFAYGARGKPRLAFPNTPLEFNLAHSGSFATYTFTIGRQLGIDIEQIRPVPDQESIVRRFFSPEECEDWLGVEPSQRNEAFFRCWTRKEAYIKAVGGGLSIPLDSFRVSLRQEDPAALIHTGHDPAAAWSLCSLESPEGYIASLAVPGGAVNVRVLPRMTVAGVMELLSK